jgi:hypothetical protein
MSRYESFVAIVMEKRETPRAIVDDPVVRTWALKTF